MNEQESDRAKEARRNRDLMPDTAAMVDAMRAAFGAGVRLKYAKEGDLEVGKKPEAEVRP